MKKIALLGLIILASCAPKEQGIKDLYADHFTIGTALNEWQITGKDTLGVEAILKHFNSIVAENCMKHEEIHPAEDVWNFELADKFVEFGVSNNLQIIGHCLVWHSQTAPWYFFDDKGELVEPEVLKARMKEHITTIVTRYKGKIHGYDVVNEAILEDGSYRNSLFYQILGEEFIPWAFECAQEADPDAELYLNDYSMNNIEKVNTYVRIANDMKARGIRIDGIGMQGHMGMDYPKPEEFEECLLTLASTGCNVMITEWDMSALPTVNTGANISDTVAFKKALNPYPDGLPEDVAAVWNGRMDTFLNIFLKHSDKITRVTAWGVSDGDSWKNNWPVFGRKEYPLLLDRDHEPKEFLNKYLN